MSYTRPNGQRRPVLDVRSDNLVYIWDLPFDLSFFDLNSKYLHRFGIVRFIETFEAWLKRRIGQVIVEFLRAENVDLFEKALANNAVFPFKVGYLRLNVKDGRRPFFDYVKLYSGVDLLGCKAIPPSFSLRDHTTPKRYGGSSPSSTPLSSLFRQRKLAADEGSPRGRKGDGGCRRYRGRSQSRERSRTPFSSKTRGASGRFREAELHQKGKENLEQEDAHRQQKQSDSAEKQPTEEEEKEEEQEQQGVGELAEEEGIGKTEEGEAEMEEEEGGQQEAEERDLIDLESVREGQQQGEEEEEGNGRTREERSAENDGEEEEEGEQQQMAEERDLIDLDGPELIVPLAGVGREQQNGGEEPEEDLLFGPILEQQREGAKVMREEERVTIAEDLIDLLGGAEKGDEGEERDRSRAREEAEEEDGRELANHFVGAKLQQKKMEEEEQVTTVRRRSFWDELSDGELDEEEEEEEARECNKDGGPPFPPFPSARGGGGGDSCARSNSSSRSTALLEECDGGESLLSGGEETMSAADGDRQPPMHTLVLLNLKLGYNLTNIVHVLQTLGDISEWRIVNKNTAEFHFIEPLDDQLARVMVLDPQLVGPNARVQLKH